MSDFDKKVLILDTSILCVWLQVPGMTTAGSEDDRWDFERVKEKIDTEEQQGTIFVLPLASIIETGNHISHANNSRRVKAYDFAELLVKTADRTTPWAAFTEQSELWTPEGLRDLALAWRDTAEAKQSIGDASIVGVANYYHKMGYSVEIFTGDKGLKSYQPLKREVYKPRRRK